MVTTRHIENICYRFNGNTVMV